MGVHLKSETTIYDKYSVSQKFLGQNTAINLVQGSIDLIVSRSEIEKLKNGNATIYSQLTNVELGLASINMAVASSVYQDIGGVLSALTQASAELSMVPGQIELATSADNLVSKINMAPDSVKIDAKNIALTGDGLIEILNTGTTRIAAVAMLSDALSNDYYTRASIDVKTNSLESSINLKVSRGALSSEISQEAGAISIRSNRLTIDSDNFTLSARGVVTATDAVIYGTIYTEQKSAWEKSVGLKLDDGIIACHRNSNTIESSIDFSANYTGGRTWLVISSSNTGTKFRVQGVDVLDLDAGNISANRNINMRGYSIYGQSDERLKNNIKSLSIQATKELGKITAISYDWKENGTHVEAGVSAQNLQKVFPELVTKNKDGYLGVNSIGLIPYLLKAIQELSEEVEDLKTNRVRR